jgi:hypothetical protein
VAAERPNGRTVVVLHGKNFSGAYWETTVKALIICRRSMRSRNTSGHFWISSPAAEQSCGGHAAPEFDTILVTGERH